MRAHMAETRTVTIMVSNIPAAPEPMLLSRSITPTVPVGSTMAAPAAIPASSTINTFKPATPPMRTST